MEDFDLSGISHITDDSRKVRAGSLFVALRGEKIDGISFIPSAESLGAVAVFVADDAILPPTKLRIIRVNNPRFALSQIAAKFYQIQPENIVAVTGTDGKTSTADFFRQLVNLCNKESTANKSVSIGTLGVINGDGSMLQAATHTTPDAIELHRILADLAKTGTAHVCLEASSHGLAQYRLHGVKLKAAAFTNIARDHLDYHKNEQEYFVAKAKLFSEILPIGAVAVINADDKRASDLRNICAARKQRIIDFGFAASEFKLLMLKPSVEGQEMRCILSGTEYNIQIPLVGDFQAMNILAAIGLAHATGISIAELIEKIPRLKGVKGRLQLAAITANNAAIYVDYAHTPAALSNLLKTLRHHTKNKLHVIFGCGGNRDVGKRAEMGKIARELADNIIVTDDNPRDENPELIRKEILKSCPDALEIADRKEAITRAIASLNSGDLLVIAGKGHEKTQIISGREYHHDDIEIAVEAASKK